MGRKKVPAKKELPKGEECQHCGASVLHNAPMSGVIADLGPKVLIICASCATEYVGIQRQILNRWG